MINRRRDGVDIIIMFVKEGKGRDGFRYRGSSLDIGGPHSVELDRKDEE